MKHKKLVISGFLVALLLGCGESAPNIPVGGGTKYLFSLKSSESIGDTVGNVSLNDNGILLHPGETTPTSITFNLDGKLHSIVLKPFIAPLDDAGKNNPLAGIVGVELLVDGRLVDKFTVDRNFSQEKTLEVNGAKSLEIRVDNGNATPVWDWFHVKVIAVK